MKAHPNDLGSNGFDADFSFLGTTNRPVLLLGLANTPTQTAVDFITRSTDRIGYEI